jgi:hypothetical protein
MPIIILGCEALRARPQVSRRWNRLRNQVAKQTKKTAAAQLSTENEKAVVYQKMAIPQRHAAPPWD